MSDESRDRAIRLTSASLAAIAGGVFAMVTLALLVYLVAQQASTILVSTLLLLAGATLIGGLMELRDASRYRE